MRILVVSNLFPPGYLGGYELGCSQVCEILSQQGHEVEVLTSDHEEDDRDDYPEGPFPVHRMLRLYVPFGTPATLMRGRRREVGKHNAWIMRKAIGRVEPDVVYFWSQLRLTVGSLRAAVQSGLPIAYRWGDAHILGYQSAKWGWHPRQIYRYLVDNWLFPDISLKGISFEHCSCISHHLKSQLIDAGLPIQHSPVVYNGIPLEAFPLKDKPGHLHDPVRILYVGQLHHYKGVHTVIEAAHRFAQLSESPVEVGIAGSGPADYIEKLRILAGEGKAQVNFLGKVPYHKLSAIYQSHDVFVFPSIWEEPQGVTYLEAMASGTPVISTVDGGHGEIIRDGENSLVFEKENVQHLSKQLAILLNKKGLRHRLIDSAKKEVKEHFTLEAFAQAELQNLEAACKKKS